MQTCKGQKDGRLCLPLLTLIKEKHVCTYLKPLKHFEKVNETVTVEFVAQRNEIYTFETVHWIIQRQEIASKFWIDSQKSNR